MSLTSPFSPERRRSLVIGSLVFAFVSLITAGIFANNNWFPTTDHLTGKRTGWFGAKLSKNAPSSWNPFAMPSPTPTPQLSKEYIYAGSRLLAVEDANASPAPPADLAVWRPSNGTWYVLGGPGSAQTTYTWGNMNDEPVEGDYDGDGKTDFAIYRRSTFEWWITRSSDSSNYTTTYGAAGAVTAPADYDGDGKTDIAYFKPSTGYWYILLSSGSGTVEVQFGTNDDLAAPADYDGDGNADITVFRPSNQTFYTFRSSDATVQYTTFGSSTDKPVSADYDGDGKANYALRSGASWIIQNASMTATITTTPSGDQASDISVHNDYDGDGICDIAVWRPVESSKGSGDLGHWYIRQSGSSGSLREESWGTEGDIPVPAFYRR